MNEFVARLTGDEREMMATLLQDEYEAGVFDTLKVLYEEEIEPFEEGYEGSPFHDFIGRLNDWEWPDGPKPGRTS